MKQRTTFLAFAFACATVLVPACSTEESGDTPSGDDAGASEGGPSGPPCSRLTTPCDPGGACEGPLDCKTNVCRDGVCNDVVPANGQKDGDETDVDCGGSHAPACADGKGCAIAADCTSAVCTGGVCQAPSPTDGVKNGDESDVDCGGAKAPKCPTGKGCAGDGDCDNVLCDPSTKKCAGPSDSDGLKNGDETGKDCGGPTTSKKCPPGEGCAGDGDCDNTRCNTGTKVCDPPSATDGLKNGTESDVDCGGGAPTNAPRCAEGKTCAADGDCVDPYCSTAKKCVTGRSCKGAVGNATAGIVTCGKRETGDATKVHESCCHSLPLPGTPAVRLDKYEVTAGRVRQFIETVGPNLRQWVNAEIAANTPTGQRLNNDIPAALRNLLPASATPGDPMNLVMQVGGTVMDGRRPSTNQGCFSDDGAYGHNTYWWPEATLDAHFGAAHKARRFTQAQYDEKSMNCSPYWVYAAFCAWDGGRMPTLAEITQVWTAAYPWGAAFGAPGPVNPTAGVAYETTVDWKNNSLFFYGYPDFGTAHDTAGYIAAPGRFPLDATSAKGNGESWQDLGANMMEMVAVVPNIVQDTTFCDFNVFAGDVTSASCNDGGQLGVLRATNMPRVPWVGGSWEGHNITRNGFNFGAQVQYGKTGFRCAR